jgi:hypothetical protein
LKKYNEIIGTIKSISFNKKKKILSEKILSRVYQIVYHGELFFEFTKVFWYSSMEVEHLFILQKNIDIHGIWTRIEKCNYFR